MFKNISESIYTKAIERGYDIAFEFNMDGKKETITYAELYKQSAALAQKLMIETKPGSRVLLIYPPSIDFIIAFLACGLSGMIAIPCYPPINEAFSKKLIHIIEDCQPSLLLTQQQMHRKFFTASLLAKIKTIAKYLNVEIFETVDENLFQVLNRCESITTDKFRHAKEWIPLTDLVSADRNDICFLQYTSGTTNSTKGVMVSHGNIIANLHALKTHFGLGESTSSVFWEPHYHDMGLIAGILMPLYNGFKAHLMSPFELIKNPLSWLKYISDTKACISGGPTFAYQRCLSIPDEDLEGLDFTSWRWIFCGAEPIRNDVLRKFAKKVENYNFPINSFITSYGLAESTLFTAGRKDYSVDDIISFDKEKLYKEGIAEIARTNDCGVEIVSCGTTSLGQDVKIVDIDTGVILPDNHVGKILINGCSVALGYWNKPELTNEIFQIDLGNGKNYLDTGDMGFFFQGELFVTGRLKEILIINGVNYNPYPIEKLVEHTSPLVKGGGVVVLQQNNIDIETISVVVEVTTKDKQELNTLCRQIQNNILSEFSLRVRKIFCFPKKFIPKTTSGKKARYKLQEMLQNPENIFFSYSETSSSISIASFSSEELETHLFQQIQILAKKLSLKSVSRHDKILSIFDDSLKQMQLISQLEIALGNKELSFSLLSKEDTFETLIQRIIQWSNKSSEEQKPTHTYSHNQLPLPPMAQMIVHCMGEKEFNLAYVCDICSDISFERIQEALKKLLSIQPYLRTSYSNKENVFIVENSQDIRDLVEYKIVHQEEAYIKSYLETCIREMSHRVHIKTPTLFKLAYVHNSHSHSNHLVLVISHLLVDPYSIWLFFNQLDAVLHEEAHYEALKEKVHQEILTMKDKISLISKEAQQSLAAFQPTTDDSEEEFLSIDVNQESYHSLLEHCKKQGISLDNLLIGLSTQALRKTGKSLSKIQFIHNGRTILQSEPLRHLIGWFNLSWPVNLPNLEKEDEYLKQVHQAYQEHERLEYAYFRNPQEHSVENHFNFHDADLEYSRIGLHHFRTDQGSFVTSRLFENDYLHGKTFADKLPRYRKAFIRPVVHDNGLKLLLFLQKGEYVQDELRKYFTEAFARIVER